MDGRIFSEADLVLIWISDPKFSRFPCLIRDRPECFDALACKLSVECIDVIDIYVDARSERSVAERSYVQPNAIANEHHVAGIILGFVWSPRGNTRESQSCGVELFGRTRTADVNLRNGYL